MPGFDRTGPFGSGPVGRGMGPCGGGQANWGRGRGYGRGAGSRWGGTPTEISPDDEKENLTRQKGWLESLLESINQRLKNLEGSSQEK